jgi:prepilin-type processing-associated H-X9-DG protein
LENNQEIATVHYGSHPALMPGWPAASDNRTSWKLAKIPRTSEVAMIFEIALMPPGSPVGSPYKVWAPAGNVPIINWANYRPGEEADGQGGHGIGPISNKSISMKPLDGPDVRNANKDLPGNRYNLRFRHRKDTVMNALMADGHVESFTYDKTKDVLDPNVTTMKLRNFNVATKNPFGTR